MIYSFLYHIQNVNFIHWNNNLKNWLLFFTIVILLAAICQQIEIIRLKFHFVVVITTYGLFTWTFSCNVCSLLQQNETMCCVQTFNIVKIEMIISSLRITQILCESQMSVKMQVWIAWLLTVWVLECNNT